MTLEGKGNADILDVCCGSRMFWFRRERKDTIFMDIREFHEVEFTHKNGTVSKWEIKPDIVADFRNIPFHDSEFSMVVYDPPHTIYGSMKSIINRKYGLLDKKTWKDDIAKGFQECMRVLKNGGFLVFKWSESNIKISEIKSTFPCEPMFGQRTNAKTMWLVFRKGEVA